jgi:stearoyl-CoA desaturase (delta-9 desaturase)
VWIGGEELHNNHHAFPSSAKFALRKFEVDIGWGVIKFFESIGMAKVLRVAPTLDVRPNINVPDTETIKALLAHRFQAMTDFQHNVLKPALKEEAQATGSKLRAMLPAPAAQGPERRRPLAQARCAPADAGMGGGASAHPRAGRTSRPPGRRARSALATTPRPRCRTSSSGAAKPKPAASARCRTFSARLKGYQLQA